MPPQITFVNPVDLDADKLTSLQKAVKSILALPIALYTFAEIIDGKPSSPSPMRELQGLVVDYSKLSDGSEPDQEAMRLFKEFRSKFDVRNVKMDIKVPIHTRSLLSRLAIHNFRFLGRPILPGRFARISRARSPPARNRLRISARTRSSDL